MFFNMYILSKFHSTNNLSHALLQIYFEDIMIFLSRLVTCPRFAFIILSYGDIDVHEVSGPCNIVDKTVKINLFTEEVNVIQLYSNNLKQLKGHKHSILFAPLILSIPYQLS